MNYQELGWAIFATGGAIFCICAGIALIISIVRKGKK